MYESPTFTNHYIPNLVFNNFLKYYIYKSTTHIFVLQNYNTKCRSQCRSCRLPVPIEATRHTAATMSLCVQRPHIDSQLDKRRLPVHIDSQLDKRRLPVHIDSQLDKRRLPAHIDSQLDKRRLPVHIDSQLDKRRLPVPIEAIRHTACINYECKLCSYRK